MYRFLGMVLTSLVAAQCNIHPGPVWPWQVSHYRSVLNIRSPQKVLLESVTRFIRERLRERKQAGLKQQISNYRIRLKQCVGFLRVYVMKKEGKSFRYISTRIKFSRRLDRAQKVKEYYKQGKQLVSSPPLLGAPYSQ